MRKLMDCEVVEDKEIKLILEGTHTHTQLYI